ncbi:MAG: signal peptidase I [Planctomycetota bacterium]
MTPPPDETEPQTEPPTESDAATPAKTEARTPCSETDTRKANKGKKDRPEPTTALGKFWVWIKPILKVILVVWLVRTALIDWNDVPTGSMEPTILVGDRILVNKMAYAGQLPLSGPKIGVPFTPLQWDNPLDFLPQLQWGRPARGDIVTFWNPISGVRMVKRIVAEPGDTVEMRGGVLIINGETASYTDTTPFPPPTTSVQDRGNAGDSGLGSSSLTVPLQTLDETIHGETRKIQHMRSDDEPRARRWIKYRGYAEFDGKTLVGLTPQGAVVVPGAAPLPTQVYAQQQGLELTRVFEVKDGAPYLDGQAVSYNDYAATWLARFEGEKIDLPNGDRLEVRGHELILNGEAVYISPFLESLRQIEDKARRGGTGKDVGLYRVASELHGLLATSFGPVTLGDDHYFMVGDNRQNSHDSRFFGPVKRGEITGEAIAVAASFNGRILQLPPEPRWKRWFKGLD